MVQLLRDGSIGAKGGNYPATGVLASTEELQRPYRLLALGLQRSLLLPSEIVAALKGLAVYAKSATFDERVDLWRTQGGGWQDILGTPVARKAAGAGVPTFSQISSGTYYGYKFGIDDSLLFTYHTPHDYRPGSSVFFHTHWLRVGTAVQPVKWRFTYSFARGYARGTFDLTGTVIDVQTTPNAVSLTHEITEAAAAALALGEVDGLLLVEVKRVTNGGVDNANDVFLLMADVHYQSDTITTKNRNYPFYE